VIGIPVGSLDVVYCALNARGEPLSASLSTPVRARRSKSELQLQGPKENEVLVKRQKCIKKKPKMEKGERCLFCGSNRWVGKVEGYSSL
jgi:hypothetical protein